MSVAAPAAFLALWNSISGAQWQPEYESWHTFEHVPERVGLPGFIEARRYRSADVSPDGVPSYFTCYWLESIAAMNSAPYHRLFAEPTPWTARMRGELRDFFRLPCTLSGGWGLSTASQLATLHCRGEAGLFAAQANLVLGRRVAQGALVCAHWGTAAETDAIPVANHFSRADADPALAAGTDFVVMLQHLEAAALRVQALEVAQALAPVASLVSPPAFFSLLSQVRHDALPRPLAARQPPRPDLGQQFGLETNHAP